MKSRLFAAAFFMALFFCMAAYAGQNKYFDANGNQITKEQYQKNLDANKARQAQHLEEVRQMQMEKEREKARKRYEKRAAKEAKGNAGKGNMGNKGNKNSEAAGSSIPSSLDQIISSQKTGANTPPPVYSDMNTFDCYTYNDVFSMAEDMYVEHISGESVIQMVLMNGEWRNMTRCGDGGFKVGKRLPDLKDVKWTHNKLNPKRKTGGYRRDD